MSYDIASASLNGQVGSTLCYNYKNEQLSIESFLVIHVV